MKFRISVAELQQLGAEWHDQGQKSGDMAAELATDSIHGPADTQAAATMTQVSVLESLNGTLLIVASAICERLEEISSRLDSIEDRRGRRGV